MYAFLLTRAAGLYVISGKDNYVTGKDDIKRIRLLHTASGRRELGLFLAEGEKLVFELISSGLKVKQLLLTPAANRALLASNVPFTEVSPALMKRITQFHSPSSVAAVVHIPPPGLLTGQRLLYLDQVADPGNMGTLIRLADWFGMDAIISREGSVDCWNPKVVQSSMGSVFRINCVFDTQNYPTLLQLKEQGCRIVGAHMNGIPANQWKPAARSVLVLGNESHGLSDGVKANCDEFVHIPRIGNAESLNVAGAAAILLYLWRQHG